MPGQSRAARALLLAACLSGLAASAACESFQSCSAKAEKARRRGDPALARQYWSDALRLWKPSHGKKPKAAALSGRALAYEQEKKFGRAIQDLSEAITLDPQNASLYHQRGRANRESGHTAAAISDLYKATTLRPSLGAAFHERARAYIQDGDAKFAHEDYRTACRLGFKPSCAEAKRKPEDLSPVRPEPAAAPRTPEPRSPDIASGYAGAEDAAPPADTAPPARYVTISKRRPLEPADTAAADSSAAVDFNACLSRMNACVDNGDSFGSCVSRSRQCESDPKRGCCPRACSVLFNNLANSKSEAQAFRAVFRRKSPCAPR